MIIDGALSIPQFQDLMSSVEAKDPWLRWHAAVFAAPAPSRVMCFGLGGSPSLAAASSFGSAFLVCHLRTSPSCNYPWLSGDPHCCFGPSEVQAPWRSPKSACNSSLLVLSAVRSLGFAWWGQRHFAALLCPCRGWRSSSLVYLIHLEVCCRHRSFLQVLWSVSASLAAVLSGIWCLRPRLLFTYCR